MPDSVKVTGIYDTHCHYEGYWDHTTFARLLADARSVGLLDSVCCPHDATRFDKQIDFCRKFGLSFALGIHPFEWQQKDRHLQSLDAFLGQYRNELVAIAEIGLDFSELRHQQLWPDVDPEISQQRQIELFETQLEIARDLSLPISVHAFGAITAVERSVKKFHGLRGVIHAFNGSAEQAKQFNKLGFLVGFGGTLTYEGSKKIRRVFHELPDCAWVLETDAPWIPCARRREISSGIAPKAVQSEPADIEETLRAAAQLRQTTREDICKIACRNSLEIFPKLHSL